MNLQEGLYVRTTNGRIAKIESIIGDYIFLDINHNIHNKNKIKSVSKDLMDLIEVGDYVNGYPVVDFDLIYFNGVDRLEEPKRVSIIVDRNSNMGFSETYFKNKDIKSIVTKEQFNSMKYEVGE